LIVGLKGIIDEIKSNSIYLNVNGVIYEVFTTLIDLNNLKVKENLEIKVIQIIREDSDNLYGFLKDETKIFFSELIKITGVGAKVAMAILSTITESELVEIIQNSDEKALIKVPKIGLKTAKRILIELVSVQDKFQTSQTPTNNEKSISIQTLEQLGFNRNEIIKVVNQSKFEKHQDIIKESLGKLSR